MPDIKKLVDVLDLETKIRLITGEDFWTTIEVPEIGLRKMTLSDGPSGVRGPVWDERSPSLNLPSATALAASWDIEMARDYAAAAASEARRKDVDWVLGPTINLHRSPLGGRHFECFSEDPYLTGDLAAAYVEGLQDNGVAATPKHYVANDSETDRFTVDVHVDERALRELYLLPFERTVEAGTWSIMSSYNSVHGVTMSENDLLHDPLRTEWGWDGVVVSDWTAVRSTNAANAEQDLEMPGPGVWGDALLEAVRVGEVDEAAIDRHVERLLLLARRVGALGDVDGPAAVPLDGEAFTRRAAVEGSVLVANNGTLPLDAGALSRVAVIGHNAREARTQGGGSATVLPESVVNPVEGIRAALPDAKVSYSLGAVVQEGLAEFPRDELANPVIGGPGMRVSFFDADGNEIFTEDRFASALTYFGGGAPIERTARVEIATTWTPSISERVALGFAGSVFGRVSVGGEELIAGQPVVVGRDLGAALLTPPSETIELDVQAGAALELRAEFDLTSSQSPMQNAWAITLGTAPAGIDPDALIREAAEAATAAEVAVVVVGTNSKVESEGFDRDHLRLPGRQDDLVRAVVAANPNTVVIVNSGSPVEMPWRDEVAAVLLGWFGGQQFGNALADVLIGAEEPGGRLPTTWPARLDDVPVRETIPTDGRLVYEEGIHVGYRAWLRAGTAPAYSFGHGLGYTTWELSEPGADVVGDAVEVTVKATNTGSRAGKQVVQVYASRANSAVERPVRWLVGFAPVRAGAGDEMLAEVSVPTRRFGHYDGGWQLEPGTYSLHIGDSLATADLVVEVEL